MTPTEERINSVPETGTDDEYAAIMEKVVPYVDDLFAGDYEWETCKETDDGVTIGRRHSTQWDGHIFRSTVTLPFSASKAAVLMHCDGPYRCQWDPLLTGIHMLRRVGVDTAIYEHRLPALFAGLVSPRASVDLVRFAKEHGGVHKIYGVSTELEGHTIVGKHVRGWMYAAGLRFAPSASDPSHCDATVLFQTDPRLRYVPRWVHEALVPMNMASWLHAWRIDGGRLQVDRELGLLGGWKCDEDEGNANG